jgi:RsiW-degrading membrane proteinase PrsW (M82 family)
LASYRARVIAPPEDEESYPYHPVWVPLAAQMLILLGVTLVVYLAFNVIDVRLLRPVLQGIDLALVALPVVLWLFFSVWRERAVQQPRVRLLTVAIVSALVANAIAIPFIDGVFQVNRWLPLSSAVSRIIGYTFTVGVTQEILKYIVIRYTAWPDGFRVRVDGVAYGIASAVGYATVLNVRFFLESSATPDIVAIQVFNNLAANVAASIIVGYGLAEVRFDRPMPFLMTFSLAFGALVNGLMIPLRGALSSTGFSLEPGGGILDILRPLFGLGLSGGALLIVAVAMGLLFANAERRALEAAAGGDR